MKLITLCAFIIFLSGCVSTTKTYAPDGRQALSIDCSGTYLTWGRCYEKAGEICKQKGYDIITENAEQGHVASGYGAGYGASSRHFRTMTIACK